MIMCDATLQLSLCSSFLFMCENIPPPWKSQIKIFKLMAGKYQGPVVGKHKTVHTYTPIKKWMI